MIRTVQILSQEECEGIREEVYRLKPEWERRHELAPFYTLGAASYLDGRDATQRKWTYYEKAKKINPLLQERFGWVLERVRDELERQMTAPCRYEERFGLPGFHVFEAHEAFLDPVASVHVDLQYLCVDWPHEDRPDFEDPLTFTVIISLPRSGGGLHVWDITHEDVKKNDHPGGVAKLAAEKTPSYHPYQIGQMNIHGGHMVHQIAPMKDIVPGDPLDTRITLQGHGIRCNGVWKLYW